MRKGQAGLAVLLLGSLLLAGCSGDKTATKDEPADAVPDLDLEAHAILQKAGVDDAGMADVATLGALRPLDHGVAEPTLAIDADGTIFVAAYPIASGLASNILRTRDGGLSWDDVSPTLAGVATHPTSFDPMVYMDPGTGRLFDIDQQGAVACYQISHSDDQGQSWLGPFAACNKPVVDHQTIVAAKPRLLVPTVYPNVLLVCYNIVVTPECIRSIDGGMTFQLTGPVPSLGIDPETDSTICSSLTGHLAAAADGTVYLPRRACNKAYVLITRDDGFTWETALLASDAVGGTGTSGPDPAVAVDNAGNVYYVYIRADGHAMLVTSTDAGRTWSEPVDVTRAGLTATNQPKVVAGDPGRIAVAYYGTRMADGFDANETTLENGTWNFYLGVVLDALTPQPTITTVRSNDAADPVVRHSCGPGRCPGGLLDFMDIEMDASGRPWAIFADACVDACAGPDGADEPSNADAGLLATLAQGPSLLASVGTLPTLA